MIICNRCKRYLSVQDHLDGMFIVTGEKCKLDKSPKDDNTCEWLKIKSLWDCIKKIIFGYWF